MNKTVLITDDDRTERRMIASVLRGRIELNIQEAENGREALRILSNDNNVAVVVLDLDMPVMGGLETLEIIKKDYAHIPVIILTGDVQADTAITAMKMGATDFLSKPVESARLDVSVKNALKMSLMSQEISRLKRHKEDSLQFYDLIGYDAGLKDKIQIGEKAATCDLPVLVTGETGTGKEMFARAIHGASNRAGQPFIAVNCGAIPEKLVESTLFGHEKGAFTGATNKSLGKFQEGNGGTIFLDEIGELPLESQVKLLRVLQQNEVEPVGAGKAVAINVRVISATNRNLIEEVKDNRFREDLYFRLNVLHVDIPPLRARKDDIPILVDHFMDQFCSTYQTLPKAINGKALEKLQQYNWPGNVRELENVINRSMALCEHDELKVENFSFMHTVKNDAPPSQTYVINTLDENGAFKSYAELEQDIIELAVSYHEGNMSQTARVLGIAKSTLYTKLDKLVDKKSA